MEAEDYYSLGQALMKDLRLEEALVAYDQAIQLRPGFAEAHAGKGLALRALKRLGEALECYDCAIQADQTYPLAHHGRGNTLRTLGRLQEALISYKTAILHKPDYAEAYHASGTILAGINELDSAISHFEQAIALRPDYADAYASRARLFYDSGRLDDALNGFSQALEFNRGDATAYFGLGMVFYELGRLPEALIGFDFAIGIRPDFVQAHINRGVAQRDLGQLDAALTSYDIALSLEPTSRATVFNRGLCYLASGDFSQGWRDYEFRPDKSPDGDDASFLRQIVFSKKALKGKVVSLYSEQGLGDTLQFCRYVQNIVELGAQVMLVVQRPLVRLLERQFGTVVAIGCDDDIPPWDYRCSLMSLPYVFSTELGDIPSPSCYLRADQRLMTKWADRLDAVSRPRVGLVWAGGMRPGDRAAGMIDSRRSIPLQSMAALRRVPGIEFISLQLGEPARQLDLTQLDFVVHDFQSELTDFAETAALVSQLDLIISVDTAVAHLGGALGIPVWLLNRFDTDWRWLYGRNDSPWYQALRLFRQPTPGNWATVMQDAVTALGDYFAVF